MNCALDVAMAGQWPRGSPSLLEEGHAEAPTGNSVFCHPLAFLFEGAENFVELDLATIKSTNPAHDHRIDRSSGLRVVRGGQPGGLEHQILATMGRASSE